MALPRLVPALAVPVLMLAQACAPNEVSVTLTGNSSLNYDSASGQCLASASSTTTIASGSLDVMAKRTYAMALRFQSQLYTSADPNTNRADSRGAFIDSIEVKVRSTRGLVQFDSVLPCEGSTGSTGTCNRVDASIFVPSSITAGSFTTLTAPVDVLPARIVEQFRSRVCLGYAFVQNSTCDPATSPFDPSATEDFTLLLTPVMHTQGGIKIRGATFQYPLSVCCGCMLEFGPSGNCDTTAVVADAVAALTSCTEGQDRVMRKCYKACPQATGAPGDDRYRFVCHRAGTETLPNCM